MPTQNPWAWAVMGVGTQCRALLYIQTKSRDLEIVRALEIHSKEIQNEN